MRAGALRDRVVFYAKVSTRDEYNASIDSWPTATITTRGEVRYLSGAYELSNEEKFYSKSIELTVRYRSNIVDTMRVQLNGTTDLYQITYKEIIGNNEGLRLTLEKLSDGLPTTVIDPPTSLVATLDVETNIILTWTNNEDDDAVSIERSEDGITYTTIHQTASGVTTYTDTYLDELTRYWYRIRSYHQSNYSEYAAIDDAITDVYVLPVIPTGLAVELITPTSVLIEWNDMDADAYQLWQSDTEEGTYTQVGGNIATTSYTHSIIEDTTHWYKVRGVRNVPLLYGEFSDAVVIDISSYWATRNPSNLIVTGMRDTEIDFSWTDNSAGDCTFAIYRSTDGINYSSIGTTIAGDTTYTATGMTAGNLYYFYVKGVKSGNESPATNIYDTRFKITIDTTKAGSPAKTFILMTRESGVYDYYVDWGEGGAEEHVIVNTNQTHVYSVDGTYQIKIRGTFRGLFSNVATDRLKVTSLDTWGNIKWQSMNLGFYSFQNMSIKYIDTPNLSAITNFYYCFGLCGNIKHSFANFNMTTVDTADGMFINANINETGTTTNYDATLISWASQAVKNNVVFHGGSSKYSDAGQVARDFLTLAVASGGKGWTITDGGHI